MENELAVGKCWHNGETGQMWRVVDPNRALLIDKDAKLVALVNLTGLISSPSANGLSPILPYEWDRELFDTLELKRAGQ
jgi:hypothetical protein